MNIEDDDAIKPHNTNCVVAKPIDEVPDPRRIEFPTKGSSTLPQAEINEPGDAEAHYALNGPEESQLTALAFVPPVEATGIKEQQIKRNEAPSESVENEAPTAGTTPLLLRELSPFRS